MKAAVGQNCETKLNSLWNSQPVELTEKWCSKKPTYFEQIHFDFWGKIGPTVWELQDPEKCHFSFIALIALTTV